MANFNIVFNVVTVFVSMLNPGWSTRFIQIGNIDLAGENNPDRRINNTSEAQVLATEVSGVGHTGSCYCFEAILRSGPAVR